MAAVAKKPRVKVSKNRKKAWNKHCDIKDVEDYLEDKRFDERVGGAASEKTDAELFFIETDIKKQGKPVKERKKFYKSIGSYSQVPAIVTSNGQPFSKRIKNFIARKDEKRHKKSLRSRPKKSTVTTKNAIQIGDNLVVANLRDIWEEKEEVDPEIADLVTFRDEYTRKRRPNVPNHRYQKPSLLPSVEVPHSGASYNPAFDEHQELLNEAVKIEVVKQNAELHLKRVLTDMFPTKAEAPTQESMLKEMSQGLFEESDEEEEEVTDNTLIPRNPPVSAEDRLRKARRRKRKELKEEKRLKLLEKIQKKRDHDIYRLRSIKSEIKREERMTEKRVQRKLEKKIDDMYKPRTLSKFKYEAPDLEVNLTEELCDSMRTLKAEGNLLEDRYKSLQRRNIIEPRLKHKMVRKYKIKKQIKRSHRNFK